MKIKAAFFIAAALLALVPLATVTASSAPPARLSGEYVWNYGSEGPLDAVFKPTGDRTYDVDFHFTFNGRDHVYRGTAEGSVSEGGLSGTVKNENQRRTFTFEGSFKDGVFRGTHAETTSGRARQTGTLTLGR